MPEEKVCAGRGVFRLKRTHYAGKDGMCREKGRVLHPSIPEVSPKYLPSIPEVSGEEG